MFTGIVETSGRIAAIDHHGASARIRVSAPDLDFDDVALGDSIAVSGPCLTVVAFEGDHFTVDVSEETLSRTTLGRRRVGDRVNLEKALRLADRLGGHLVTGHIDGVATVRMRDDSGDWTRFRIEAPSKLARYIAEKGSACIDGVSLTVNEVDGNLFDLLIIPHTLEVTTLGSLAVGAPVNLEVDIVARYIERMITARKSTDGGDPDLWSALKSSGFVAD